MLTDKQSLILCATVALGFSACGIIGILDNYAVIGLLVVCFLVIIANILIIKSKKEFYEQTDELDNSDQNEI
ncbi:hypothetical protein [Hanstruepera marina]|uniref:hypothetical protein n=1 Tax=Hanstruepera marina TaxID=2873265 RepID=UPI001CA79F43|nr:hypothetical protein [Hanstruepera marina]